MALLRLLSLPSTSQFSTQYFFSPTPSIPIPPNINSCICFYTSPFSHPLSLKTQRPNLYLFPVSSTATHAEEATIVTPPLEEQKKEEGEAFGTRLLVLNVPWSSTPDDIRPLFEKYGTVLDIEEFEGRILRLAWAKPKKEKPTPLQTCHFRQGQKTLGSFSMEEMLMLFPLKSYLKKILEHLRGMDLFPSILRRRLKLLLLLMGRRLWGGHFELHVAKNF